MTISRARQRTRVQNPAYSRTPTGSHLYLEGRRLFDEPAADDPGVWLVGRLVKENTKARNPRSGLAAL